MKDKSLKYHINSNTLLILMLFLSGFLFSQVDELSRATIKTVVIDAGHGGKDPGCHGQSAHEKHVCLSMALKLGGMIKKKYPQIKVIYTRDKDVFVELDERAKIANRNKADLFICIHANSAGEAVFGVETYVLGLHKTEAQQLIAERENSTIYLEEDKGAKYKDFDLSPDAIIARQIQLSVFLDQSISFASKVQSEFKKIGRSDRGVKQAGFLVLYKTTMPSILIETGFLTNPTEEKYLNDSINQHKMSTGMFTAFESYRNELEGIVSKSNPSVLKVDEVKESKNPFVNEEKQELKKEVKQEPKNEIAKVEVKQEPKKEVKSEIKIEKSIENNNELDKVIFRVQIETSDRKIEQTNAKFKGMEIFEYQQDKLFKYTVGKYLNDFKGANILKNNVRSKGFSTAFVVAFFNGERINLEKAIKLAEK
jgi:N-acetylmuramoyl-L-alanine amidase